MIALACWNCGEGAKGCEQGAFTRRGPCCARCDHEVRDGAEALVTEFPGLRVEDDGLVTCAPSAGIVPNTAREPQMDAGAMPCGHCGIWEAACAAPPAGCCSSCTHTKRPEPVVAVGLPDLHTATLEEVFVLRHALRELRRSRSKFPRSEGLAIAIMEEAGEVASALLEQNWQAVTNECADLAGTALRLALDGDSALTALRLRTCADKIAQDPMRPMERP